MKFKVTLKNKTTSRELSVRAPDENAARREAIKRHVATPGYLGYLGGHGAEGQLSAMWVTEVALLVREPGG